MLQPLTVCNYSVNVFIPLHSTGGIIHYITMAAVLYYRESTKCFLELFMGEKLKVTNPTKGSEIYKKLQVAKVGDFPLHIDFEEDVYVP